MIVAGNLEAAMDLAKEVSIKKPHKTFFVISCMKSKKFYVDTDSRVRNFETIEGQFSNGKFKSVD